MSTPRKKSDKEESKGKKVMVALSDSQLLYSVWEMALSRVKEDDTLYAVTLGASLLARSGRADQSYGAEKLTTKLREDFEKPAVEKGVKFEPVVRNASKTSEIKNTLVELTKEYDVDELIVGYSTAKLFQESVASHCVTKCACNVLVVKKASKTA